MLNCTPYLPDSNQFRVRPIFLVLVSLLICLTPRALYGQQPVDLPQPSSGPSELQASDPNIKRLLDSIESSEAAGKYADCPAYFTQALELATKQRSFADRGVVEERFATFYFVQGRVEDAKSQWVNSLSDAAAVSNLVLEADVLIALSDLEQASHHPQHALQLILQATELARKGKSLFILSRALGELSRLQLLAGKRGEARASIDEALRLDEINHYDWKAAHLLVMAWVNADESDTSKALEFADSSRTLAISTENYIVFTQASQFLGQAYVHIGQIEKGIRALELAQKGLSEQDKPLFHSPQHYAQEVSLPYLRISFLEALSLAYEAGNRYDDALRSWQELYQRAAAAQFSLAKAESARHLAELYKTKKDFDKSISEYASAADAFVTVGDKQSRLQVLASEAFLLSKQGKNGKAVDLEEQILSLTKSSEDARPHFIADLAIAELLDGTGPLDRIEIALKDAETLVGPDVTFPHLEPSFLVELYNRIADDCEKRKDYQNELIALVKALTPALALANAPKEAANKTPLASLAQRLEKTFSEYHAREVGESAYSNKHYSEALVSFELVQYFEEFEAARSGHSEEYMKNLNSDPTFVMLLGIPAKLIAQDGGASILTANIQTMGPLAGRIRLPSMGLLANYFMSQKRFDLVAKYTKQALIYFGAGDDHPINQWSVATSCELAYALAMQKEIKSASDYTASCLDGAERLSLPPLLQIAHETNIWFLSAANRPIEAEKSIQYLLTNKPNDPLTYQQLAQLRTQEGNKDAAADAWNHVLQIYDGVGNVNGSAAAHQALGNLLLLGTGASAERGLQQLKIADEQFRATGSNGDRISTETSLGAYYARHRNPTDSQLYFGSALKLARETKSTVFEANVLSQIGQTYEASDDYARAIEYYRQSANLYAAQKDNADEALQLKNVANVLNNLHKSDDAMTAIMNSKTLADESGSWLARYWARRTLAQVFAYKGDYQHALITLQEAKEIALDAAQPLPAAWASLALAPDLEIVGNWQEAADQAKTVLPVFAQFNDTEDESAAYAELMAVYSARESNLRDLPQALSFYQSAYQLIEKTHPDRAAALDLDLTETYWNQGRFPDAIEKAGRALDFYNTLKDDLGQASALISLAEAQRSNGNLDLAAGSLRLATPLVAQTKNFYTYGRFYYVQAGLYRAQGRFDKAINEYERVIGMLEQFKSSSDSEEAAISQTATISSTTN